MKKKLAIIGASYLQESLVLKAKNIGIETHCFAWEDGATCKDIADHFYPISIIDKENILKKCIEINIDGITTIASDVAVPTIGYVANKLGLISNSVNSCLYATNKAEMRKKLEQDNCSIPSYKILTSEYDNVGDIKFPVIVKPVDRSGSRGVTKVDNIDFLNEALKKATQESFSKQVIVEQFIEGTEVSVESISWNGKHYILAITDKVTTNAPNFVELAHHQPSLLDIYVQNKIKKETIKCLNALEINFGASHAEFKITASGEVYVIEVGARMGGDFIGSHLVELSTGYDFLKGVIDVALGEFTIPESTHIKNSGVYFLCKQTESLKKYFSLDNEFDFEKKIQSNELNIVTSSNERSGYLIYQSNKRVNLL